MRAGGGTTVCRAIRMVATAISFQFWSPVWCVSTKELLRDSIGPGEDCLGTTFLSLGKISRIYLSIIEVLSEMTTAKFSTLPKHTQKLKLPMGVNNEIVR